MTGPTGASRALPAWFLQFCTPGADRLALLAQVLHAAGVPFELVKTGAFRHVQVRPGRAAKPEAGEKLVLAHYDRVAGSPGANDNGASVLALVEYLRQPRKGLPLRVVFTDGEELPAGVPASDQGAFALAHHWGPLPGVFPVVLDMTGIGDTVVLGHLGEHLIRKTRPGGPPTDLDAYARQRLGALRWLATCGAGDTLEVNTPFSDDLGLFLAGIPAVQVSLLPRRQALAYRKAREAPGELEGREAGPLPPAWRTMHTPDDKPENLTNESRVLVAQLLDRLEVFPSSGFRGP
ncbi:MAG: M28 family peptidase [Spirochaetales bacterium]